MLVLGTHTDIGTCKYGKEHVRLWLIAYLSTSPQQGLTRLVVAIAPRYVIALTVTLEANQTALAIAVTVTITYGIT